MRAKINLAIGTKSALESSGEIVCRMISGTSVSAFEPDPSAVAAHVVRLQKHHPGIVESVLDRRQAAAARVGAATLDVLDSDLGDACLDGEILLLPSDQGARCPDLAWGDHVLAMGFRIPAETRIRLRYFAT
jgi:hypothetical protein